MITQNFDSSLSLFLYQLRVSQRSESLIVFLLLKIISRYITQRFEIIRLMDSLQLSLVNVEALIICNYTFLFSLFNEVVNFFVH